MSSRPASFILLCGITLTVLFFCFLQRKTLDLLADGELSDVGNGVGQPGDVVYIEGNMPLLIVVPHGGAGAQAGRGGGGSVWWNEWCA